MNIINKIKQWIIDKNLVHIAIIVITIFVCVIITFLAYFKFPINMENKNDLKDITELIKNNNTEGEILNVELKSGIVYRELNDTLFSLSRKLNTEDDIAMFTKVLVYKVVKENDTIPSITIFEVKNSFLKEKVGKHLITINNFRK